MIQFKSWICLVALIHLVEEIVLESLQVLIIITLINCCNNSYEIKIILELQ